MASNSDRLKAIAPEFNAVQFDIAINTHLQMAGEYISTKIFTEVQRNCLIIWLTAHTLTIAFRDVNATAFITDARQGSLSISRASPSVKDSLDTTIYGIEYKRFRDSFAPFTMLVTDNTTYCPYDSKYFPFFSRYNGFY